LEFANLLLLSRHRRYFRRRGYKRFGTPSLRVLRPSGWTRHPRIDRRFDGKSRGRITASPIDGNAQHGSVSVARVTDALGDDLPAPTDAPLREGADVPADAGLHEVVIHDDGDPGVPLVDWSDSLDYVNGDSSVAAVGAVGATAAT